MEQSQEALRLKVLADKQLAETAEAIRREKTEKRNKIRKLADDLSFLSEYGFSLRCDDDKVIAIGARTLTIKPKNDRICIIEHLSTYVLLASVDTMEQLAMLLGAYKAAGSLTAACARMGIKCY